MVRYLSRDSCRAVVLLVVGPSYLSRRTATQPNKHPDQPRPRPHASHGVPNQPAPTRWLQYRQPGDVPLASPRGADGNREALWGTDLLRLTARERLSRAAKVRQRNLQAQ
jgi:hypothetical protein